MLASASPLTIVATDVEAGEAHALRSFANATDLVAALRASATMPVVAGGPRSFGGRRYLDASISEPIPVPTAERDGHTHVLALLTRSGASRPQPSSLDRYYVAPRLRRISPNLARQYMNRAAPYDELIRYIDAGTGPLGRSHVLPVRVLDCHISRLERRRTVLEDGARRGYAAVMALFDER